jgi:high-affinity nickel-transport protein
MDAVIVMGVALGLRHGTDPDHLAAIDGLTRLRPNPANGVFFALGHGLTVTLLAVVSETWSRDACQRSGLGL